MRCFIILISLIASLCTGCAGKQSPQTAASNDLHAFLSNFERAVKNKNADEVYSMLDSNWKNKFNKLEFSTYFNNNYDLFIEYIESISDSPKPFEFTAIFENDPCASALFLFDETGYWKLSDIPTTRQSPDQIKAELIQAMKSQRFMRFLDDYAKAHPDIDLTELRHLKRMIAFEPIPLENVEFEARRAIVVIPDTANIIFSCDNHGWSLNQCQLFH